MTSSQPQSLPRRAATARSVVVVVVSFLLGASLAQGLLPAALAPFANSTSGWTILTALLVWAARRGLVLSAVLGAASFIALVSGYTFVSNLRGFYFSPLFWSVVGVVAGPVVGVAAAALHRRGWELAVGAGVLAGILLGDAAYGLTVVVATTGWVYWALSAAVGAALLVVVGVRLGGWRLVLIMVGSAFAVAVLVNIGFAVLNAGYLGWIL
jgi:hypothetical protein